MKNTCINRENITSSCNCVNINNQTYNSEEVERLIRYYQNLIEEPSADTCNWIINQLNKNVKENYDKYKKSQVFVYILIGALVILIISYYYPKFKKKK